MYKKVSAIVTSLLVTSVSLCGKPLFNVGSSGEVKVGPFDKTTIVNQSGRTLRQGNCERRMHDRRDRKSS